MSAPVIEDAALDVVEALLRQVEHAPDCDTRREHEIDAYECSCEAEGVIADVLEAITTPDEAGLAFAAYAVRRRKEGNRA